MIKMVVTDIDGTILNWSGLFSPFVIDCINEMQEKGIKVVLATGRMHASTVPISRALSLNNPIISYQGGLIKDVDGTTLYQQILPTKYVNEIINWAKQKNAHLNLYMNDNLYVEQDCYEIRKYIKGKFVNFHVQNFSDLELKDINKLLAINYEDADLVTSWEKELSAKYPDLYIVKSTPYFCEIGSKDAKKSLGVEFLSKLWNIKKEEILTIGDQNNDIELLKAGGIAVAMGNATDELKEYADYITDTVDDDGFVKAMNKFVFQR